MDIRDRIKLDDTECAALRTLIEEANKKLGEISYDISLSRRKNERELFDSLTGAVNIWSNILARQYGLFWHEG